MATPDSQAGRSATLDTDDKSRSPLGETVKDPVLRAVRSQTATADDRQVAPAVERALALTCHLSVVLALLFVGRLHFEDMRAGAAATLYLLLPYTPLLMPASELPVSSVADLPAATFGRWDHAWPMAWLTWAVVAYRKPAIAGALVGVAAGSAFFPVLLAPIWLSFYARRGLGRFLTVFLLAGGVCLAVLALVVSVNGEWPASMRSAWTLLPSGVADLPAATFWQPWWAPAPGVPAPPGVWQGVHWAYRLPVFIAFLAFVPLHAPATAPAPAPAVDQSTPSALATHPDRLSRHGSRCHAPTRKPRPGCHPCCSGSSVRLRGDN